MFNHLVRKSFSQTVQKLLVVGQEASIKKKITVTDLEDFIKITGDTNPIHFTSHGQRAIIHGAYLNTIISNLLGTKLPGPGAMVVKQTLNFPSKCFVDDTVIATVKIVEVRKLIKVEFNCMIDDENRNVVMFGDANLIMDKTRK